VYFGFKFCADHDAYVYFYHVAGIVIRHLLLIFIMLPALSFTTYCLKHVNQFSIVNNSEIILFVLCRFMELMPCKMFCEKLKIMLSLTLGLACLAGLCFMSNEFVSLTHQTK